MKTSKFKFEIVIGLLLIMGVFTSCKNTTTKKEVIEIGESFVPEMEEIKVLEARKPIVFITGYDKGKSSFYSNAREYFKSKNYQIVEESYSLEEIINWMNFNATKNPYGEVHIVAYNNPWKGMNLETVIKGEPLTSETLRKNITQGKLPVLTNTVTSDSKIIFHSNELGKNKDLMKSLKDAFVADQVPQIIASPFHSVFGGEFSNHYLAKPYYIFYPTANSPGKVDLSKEISKKYPLEKEIDWLAALSNKSERYVGEAFVYKFNIPVKWERDYTNSDDEIPVLQTQTEIIDWISNDEDFLKKVQDLNIPLKKFRWSSKIKDNVLFIYGKTTAVCVLKPLIKPYGELKHIEPNPNNKRLYTIE